MEVLDGNVITTALPESAKSMAKSPIDVSAYLLSPGIFVPVSGWIADRLGARTVYVTAVTLFTLTSALCA
jgi:MFS family permease